MNPPGIPHLYVATDLETAFEETKREKGIYKIAELIMNQPIVLIDLSDLPHIPSKFDPNPMERAKVKKVTFLQDFENEINKRTAGDEKNHIDYVPSRVFCEYIKEKSPDIGGIIYNSKKCISGKNVCLFIERDELSRILHLGEIKSQNYE